MLSVNYFKRLLLRIARNGASVSKYLSGQSSASHLTIEHSENVGNEWDNFRRLIANEFQAHPMDFLRQKVIGLTVHPNQQELANKYLLDMSKNDFARKNILTRLHDVPIGDPYTCENFPFASPMSIQHAYYISLIKEKFDIFP